MAKESLLFMACYQKSDRCECKYLHNEIFKEQFALLSFCIEIPSSVSFNIVNAKNIYILIIIYRLIVAVLSFVIENFTCNVNLVITITELVAMSRFISRHVRTDYIILTAGEKGLKTIYSLTLSHVERRNPDVIFNTFQAQMEPSTRCIRLY